MRRRASRCLELCCIYGKHTLTTVQLRVSLYTLPRFLLDGGSQGRAAIITHIAEGLATAFILAKRVPNPPGTHIPDSRKSIPDDGNLHNIVLGRGWLGTLDLWKSSVSLPSHHQAHIEDFVKLLHPLLRMLYTLPTGEYIDSSAVPNDNSIE